MFEFLLAPRINIDFAEDVLSVRTVSLRNAQDSRLAAAPATWAAAMEVPVSARLSGATTLTPGAARSGLIVPSLV